MARQVELREGIGLALSDARAPECEEPTQTRSEALVWTCKQCFRKKAQRVVTSGSWHWACDTCGTRVDDNENDTAAVSGSGDPFAQLTRELAKSRGDEIENRLRDKQQLSLDYNFADKPPPDRGYDSVVRQLKEVRGFAQARGISLLFDNFRCDSCDCKDIRRVFNGQQWAWRCERCGEFKSGVDALKQLQGLFYSKPAEKIASFEERENGIEVFKMKDLHNITDNIGTFTSDEHSKSRLKSTLARILETGTVRPYVIPGAAWQGHLDELREHFPNFLDAIDEVLEPSFAIGAAGGRCRPAPMLLVGPPGVGKSYFSSLIAGVLKTPMFKVNLASATAGSSIDGLATHWGNSSPGEVFRTLAFGRNGVAATACPVGFLDEIDKVGGDIRYDPLGALYSLLEVQSAKTFEDQSLPGLRVDASHVRWIACANELDPIPKPILSRFHIVHVQAPTAAETHRMFGKIFAGVVNDTGLTDFGHQIPKSVIDTAVEKFSAREFKTRSVMAIGRALARNRHFVEACDFGSAPAPATRKMGF